MLRPLLVGVAAVRLVIFEGGVLVERGLVEVREDHLVGRDVPARSDDGRPGGDGVQVVPAELVSDRLSAQRRTPVLNMYASKTFANFFLNFLFEMFCEQYQTINHVGTQRLVWSGEEVCTCTTPRSRQKN